MVILTYVLMFAPSLPFKLMHSAYDIMRPPDKIVSFWDLFFEGVVFLDLYQNKCLLLLPTH